MRLAALLTASLFCASCDRPPIDPSQSLVGAKTLPPARVLSREIIEINFAFGEPGPRLIFELKPNNVLTVTRTDWDRQSSSQVIQGKTSFQLSADAGVRVRRLLWRVRPEKFRGFEWDTKPLGCADPLFDEIPDFTVGFIAEAPKSNDDQIRVFDVFPSCKTKEAAEARNLLSKVLATFPPSKVAAEYESRVQILQER